MAAFPYHKKMPLEWEREFLSRSVVTDTRYAAQVMRWEGRRENSVNSGTAREMFVQLEPGEYLLECSSTEVHLKFDTNNLSSAGKHQQHPSAEPRQLRVDVDGWVGSKEATVRSSSQQDQEASPLPSGGKGWGHAHHPYVVEVVCALVWGSGRLQGVISSCPGSMERQ